MDQSTITKIQALKWSEERERRIFTEDGRVNTDQSRGAVSGHVWDASEGKGWNVIFVWREFWDGAWRYFGQGYYNCCEPQIENGAQEAPFFSPRDGKEIVPPPVYGIDVCGHAEPGQPQIQVIAGEHGFGEWDSFHHGWQVETIVVEGPDGTDHTATYEGWMRILLRNWRINQIKALTGLVGHYGPEESEREQVLG
jgi:hypothetical protein